MGLPSAGGHPGQYPRPLFIGNRSGNRPSQENSAFDFELTVHRCRTAGFRKVVLRGDMDFALTENSNRGDDDNVEFVHGDRFAGLESEGRVGTDDPAEWNGEVEKGASGDQKQTDRHGLQDVP